MWIKFQEVFYSQPHLKFVSVFENMRRRFGLCLDDAIHDYDDLSTLKILFANPNSIKYVKE